MKTLLKKLHQDHVCDILNKISVEDKRLLLSQINMFDKKSLIKQKKDFFSSVSFLNDVFPWPKCGVFNEHDRKIGENVLKKGQIALVMLAGGQGTRLGFLKPKGCFPVSLIKNKSLFQLFFEKIIAAKKKYHVKIPIAIMVSPLNEKEIFSFFQKNNFFSLDSNDVFFFKQNMLPLLDEKGRWVISAENKVATGPDGNGDLFYHLYKSGIWKIFNEKKIKYLSVFSVDNPLLNPMEESLLGYHKSNKNDVTIRVIEKEKNMGLLAEKDGMPQIIEYLYFEDKKNIEKDFLFANANHFIIDMSFAEMMQKKSKELFYHPVKKIRRFQKEKKEIYKSEKFLFDSFIFADKTGVLLYPKKECFSPLKNKEDICFVKKDLFERDKQILSDLGIKKSIGQKKIELSQDFYFPTQELIEKCKKNSCPLEGYIQETDLV